MKRDSGIVIVGHGSRRDVSDRMLEEVADLFDALTPLSQGEGVRRLNRHR